MELAPSPQAPRSRRRPIARARGGSPCFSWSARPASLLARSGYVSLVGLGADGVTFFVGSIFFTSAAALQYLEAVNTRPGMAPERTGTRYVSWEPHRIDWLATSIQLVGTVFFNISTFRAMIDSFDAGPDDLLSWRHPTPWAPSASSSRAGSRSQRPVIAGSRGARTTRAG